MRKTIVLLATSLMLLAGCSTDEPAKPNNADTPAAVVKLENVDSAGATLEPQDSAPDAFNASDITEEEQAWLDKAKTKKTQQPQALVAADGTGIIYEAGEVSLIRLYQPSEEMQGYLKTVAPALQAWYDKNKTWPVGLWDPNLNKWVLQGDPANEDNPEPVQLDLPETFTLTGFSAPEEKEGYYYFLDTATEERAAIRFEEAKPVSMAAQVTRPVK